MNEPLSRRGNCVTFPNNLKGVFPEVCKRSTPFDSHSSLLYNSTKKRQHYFDILKAFFVRHSSEYKTSDSDRKVNRNIYPDAVTRDRMRLIDPKSGQLEPIHHCC